MSDSILDDLLAQVASGPALEAMSQQLGADPQATRAAASAALPALLGALDHNARGSGGADALLGALQRDHDGGVLDDVLGLLGGGSDLSGGAAILGHVLGGRLPAVESELGRETGLDAGTIGRLLMMLAPLVMGALGRRQREGQLDSRGLSDVLSSERSHAERSLGGSFGALGRILDSDGDGQVDEHVVRLGSRLLGRLFGGRR